MSARLLNSSPAGMCDGPACRARRQHLCNDVDATVDGRRSVHVAINVTVDVRVHVHVHMYVCTRMLSQLEGLVRSYGSVQVLLSPHIGVLAI